MAITSLLEIDLCRVLRVVSDLCKIKLPSKVIELSLAPSSGILHIRFKEPKKAELGEPLHPLIHIFRNEEIEEITALEIINIEKLISLRP